MLKHCSEADIPTPDWGPRRACDSVTVCRIPRAGGISMSEAVVDDIVAVLPPLLQSLEALGFVARYLNPPDFGRVMEEAGQPDEALRAVRPRLSQWPAEFDGIKTALET